MLNIHSNNTQVTLHIFPHDYPQTVICEQKERHRDREGERIELLYTNMYLRNRLRFFLFVVCFLEISACTTERRCYRQPFPYEIHNKAFTGATLVREGPWPFHKCRRFVDVTTFKLPIRFLRMP